MESITLINPNKATFTFTLYHSVYCGDVEKCACTRDAVLRTGVGGQYYAEVVNPVGVYLEPGEKRTFHSNVLKIQQIQTALEKGLLKQVKVEATTSKNKKSSE